MLDQASLALVDPKPAFLSWLEEFLAQRSESLDDEYHEEENGAYLIAAVGSFGSEEARQAYLEQLKPHMLQCELNRFLMPRDPSPWPIDAATFDRFFTLRVRDVLDDARARPRP